jgi:hypothetical protein
MNKKELQDRLKTFAIAIVKFAESLPNTPGLRTVKNQIVVVVHHPLLIIGQRVERNQQQITFLKWAQLKKNWMKLNFG